MCRRGGGEFCPSCSTTKYIPGNPYDNWCIVMPRTAAAYVSKSSNNTHKRLVLPTAFVESDKTRKIASWFTPGKIAI